MDNNGQITATIGFEQQIWKAADILRGNIDASEYKHVILGLIFLKYISDRFIEDIAKQEFILTLDRYVGIEEKEDDGEPCEEIMARLTSKLSVMFKRSHELEDEIRKRLGAIGFEI